MSTLHKDQIQVVGGRFLVTTDEQVKAAIAIKVAASRALPGSLLPRKHVFRHLTATGVFVTCFSHVLVSLLFTLGGLASIGSGDLRFPNMLGMPWAVSFVLAILATGLALALFVAFGAPTLFAPIREQSRNFTS